jgi:tetratricopeptide (TPR) repeat protein/tRNA A-37 threonylcarbamoyl transferase component Bud32
MPGKPHTTESDMPERLSWHGPGVNVEPDRESRLFSVLTTYLQAVEAGVAERREVWLENHPDLAADLAAFLDEEDRLFQLISPLGTLPEREEGLSGEPIFPDQDGSYGRRSPGLPLDHQGGDRTPKIHDFGDYELIELIGSGGMGVVFRARQTKLDRQVAIKMIRDGDLATEDDRRRFRLEAGASAQLDHPHIVPIYEVGEHAGHCYYAMKLIEGGSLDRRLDDFVHDARAAARLVAPVARAVHHAHQRGVLHRDLKPSNILIDGEGRGHVADFGLAKRLGADHDATQTGVIIGTPSYMAPEQALGKKDAVTTATDVYGLGALLYALLSGRPPFRGDSILDTIEQVRLREPEPPTSSSGHLDRDLQTICLTCLRKEPSRRYASAAALADDLDRWIQGEPIAARPMKNAERAWRWARREPLSAGLAAALACLSVVVLAGLVVSNVMISRERDLARNQQIIALQESRHAEAERHRAIERTRQARRAVDEMYTEVAEKWLSDQPKLSQVQRDFLKKALAFYEQFSREEGDDPSVRLERSKALSRLAWLQLRLGQSQETAATLYKPVEILRSLIDQYPDDPLYLEELGDVYGTLASRFSEQKRWQDANAAREQALACDKTLVSRVPREPRHRLSLATNQAQLALQYQSSGHPVQAQNLAAESLASLECLKRDFPGRSDPHDRSTRMRVLEDVGCVLIENRRFGEAETALREAIMIAEKLPEDVISHHDLLHRIAHINNYLGNLLVRVGRGPDHPLYQVDVVDAQLGLVDVYRETGRRPAAVEHARIQVDRSERLAVDHPDLVNCRRTLFGAITRLGSLLAETGPPREAEAAYQRAIAVAESLAAVEPSGVTPRHHLARSLLSLGGIQASSGRTNVAEPLLARAVGTLEKLAADCPAVPDFKQTLGDALATLGDLQRATGRRQQAEQNFERAVELFDSIVSEAEHDPELASLCVRGLTSCPERRFRNPARALELAVQAARHFPDHRLTARTLGVARYSCGDWSGAIASLTTSRFTDDRTDIADLFLLAMAHQHNGDNVKARQSFEHAVEASATGVQRRVRWRQRREEAQALLGIP